MTQNNNFRALPPKSSKLLFKRLTPEKVRAHVECLDLQIFKVPFSSNTSISTPPPAKKVALFLQTVCTPVLHSSESAPAYRFSGFSAILCLDASCIALLMQ